MNQQDKSKKPDTTNQNEHPEITEVNWIDDAFYVKKGMYLWTSVDKEGKNLLSSLTEEECIKASRFYLKRLQEGWGENSIKYEGTVGGKL